MFTVDQNLAQSIWKSLGLNRRRLTEQMVERLFREWDADGSKGISRKEFTHAVMRLRPITSPMEIKAAFNEADLNQDGVIEMNEFVAWFDLNRLT
jgi:Ca2+-binding EF-hand superfamily protein